MVFKRIILSLIIFVGFLGLLDTPAFAYSVDGLLSDWGINLASSQRYYLDGQSVSSSTAHYISEDNADVEHQWTNVGPGYSYYNLYDAEAMMFDNDNSNFYFAIVTGLPETGATCPTVPSSGNPNYPYFMPGDIFIDIGSNGVYEFGINYQNGLLYQLSGVQQDVYYDGVLHNPNYSAANPWLLNGSLIDTPIEFIYTDTALNSHYVIEGGIPLSALGLDGDHQTTPVTVHWTMQCGNDVLNLGGNVTTTPEPASMALLGLGLLGMARRFKKK